MNFPLKMSKNSHGETLSRKRKRITVLANQEEEQFLSHLYSLQIQIEQNAMRYERYVQKDKVIRHQLAENTKKLETKLRAIMFDSGMVGIPSDPYKFDTKKDVQIVPRVTRREMAFKMFKLSQRYENQTFDDNLLQFNVTSHDAHTQTAQPMKFSQFTQTEEDVQGELMELRLFQEMVFLSHKIESYRGKKNGGKFPN